MSTSGVTTVMGAISDEDASDDASLTESRAAAAATVFNKLVDSSALGLVKELLIFDEKYNIILFVLFC